MERWNLAGFANQSGDEAGPINLATVARADALTGLLLAGALTNRHSPIKIRRPTELSSTLRQRIQRSILRHLLLKDEFVLPGRSISPEEINIGNGHIGTKTVLLTTESLVCDNERQFQTLLARAFRSANIALPSELLFLVASLAFEATINAEEHGGVVVNRPYGVTLRGFAAIQHRDGSQLHAAARAYVRSYTERFGPPDLGWLEIVIVDNGMGVAFPGYYILARSKAWSNLNVYAQDVNLERARLEISLADGFTTKGAWGRLITTQTRPGSGTQHIRERLASVRGYAALRTGRSLANWSYLHQALSKQVSYVPQAIRSDSPTNLQPYKIRGGAPESLYQGTAWQFVIPLRTQIELPV